MKTRSSSMAPWLTALVCLSLAPTIKATDEAEPPMAPTAQEASADAKSGQQGMQPGDMSAQSSHDMSMETQSSEATPTRANKASNILGMKVRNQNNQYLGRIKDLVIDWKTEQVAYAVLSTGGSYPFGQGAKLLAVPLTALTASTDQKHLVLNADKSKVETAMGFDPNNWPSVNNPSWGAQPFWQRESTTSPMSDQPAKGSDTKAKEIITPGESDATDPNSILGEEPAVMPDRDVPAKPDMPPESKPQSDTKSDTGAKDNPTPEQDPEAPPK
jgi:sporulation protein YlmC with PRC-barrel domain